MRILNLTDILSVIGREGDPRKKDDKPFCFGTDKVLELNSDIHCISCDSWKYSCLFQNKMSGSIKGHAIDFSDLNLDIGE